MALISIRTTTYNREHLLPRAIESVLSQIYTDFEYWIINNGSNDGTQEIIDKYIKQDKRVNSITYPFNNRDSVIALERKNKDKMLLDKYWDEGEKVRQLIYPANNSEAPIIIHEKRSTSENNRITPYFTSIDDDDFMEPTTIETLFRLITEYDADISTVGSRFIYPDGTIKDKFVFDGIFVYNRIEAMIEMLKREKFNQASGSKLFRRKIELEDHEVPKVSLSRDIHQAFKRLNKINRMVVSGEPLFYFYRHDNNQSGLDTAEQITPEKMRQHLEANTMRTQWLSEHMPEIKDYVFYCELSFMISLYERINRMEIKDCYEIADKMGTTLLSHNNFLSNCGFCTEKEKGILKSL